MIKMPFLEIIRFEPEHFGQFILRGYKATPIEVFPDLKKRAEELDGTAAYTAMVDGEIIACAGVVKLWPGVGEAWMMVSGVVEKYPVFFHRTVKRILNRIQEKYQLHRIQGTVRADFEKGHHWIETLGFRCEGLQRMFGADRADHYRYARTAWPTP